MTFEERQVKRIIEKRGHVCLRNGWPDFIIDRGKYPPLCIEVKTEATPRVEIHQKKVLDLLTKWGLDCHVLTFKGGSVTEVENKLIYLSL
jgi:Holliday junction resolvase